MLEKILKNFPIILFAGVAVLLGCSRRVEDNRVFYRANHGKDTALLAISTSEVRFFGQYERWYGSRSVRDSGAVEGLISGDTLRGKYRYRSYGGEVKIAPVIFLRSGKKLILGDGVTATYMGIAYYTPEVPIEFNDSGFVFKEITKPLKYKK